MKIENKYLYYFRYYRYERNDDFSWWFCRTDFEVYSTNDLYNKFEYISKEQINCSDIFVEFSKIDIIELQKQYLYKILPRTQYKSFESFSDEEFNLNFCIYMERNHLIIDWYEYEKIALESVYFKWRKDNNINLK